MSISTANPLLSLRLTRTSTAAEVAIPETTPTSVATLTRRLAAGDEAAFREFHEQYFARLYRFLIVVTRGQEHEAQEALQETLLRVVRYARGFDDEEMFWCWLKAVARSVARDGGRKRRRYFALLENFARWQHNGADAANAGESDSLPALLAEGLAELPVADRRLVEAKYLEGSAVKELAASSGSTEKAIESKLLRLRRQLRERLLKKLNEI